MSYENVQIIYDGFVLVEGRRPLGEKPVFNATDGSHGFWGGEPFTNLIHNGSEEKAGLRFRPWFNDLGSKFLGDNTRPCSSTLHFVFLEDVIMFILAPVRIKIKDIKFEIGARNTDLFFYDCVVLIEGETEDRILPIISDAMGYDLAEKGIKLINIRGSGKTTKINEFLNYLKDSGIIIYVIADGHEDVSKKIKDWIREGLLDEDNYSCWDEEIEDVLGFERVISAIKMVMKDSDDFTLSVEDLKKGKEVSGKPISKVLQQILYEKGFSLDKPTLGEKLGLLIADELNNGENREESEVEKAIRKIVKLVE